MHSPVVPISIDVVLPSHNSQETIEQCLHGLTSAIDHSINEKLCDEIHIYIVDDGSIDSSTDFIETFTKTSKHPATLIKQTQQGPSAARNAGTQPGTAPWILYIDSDVEPHEQAMSNLLKLQRQHPECRAFNGHPQHHVPMGSWTTQYTNFSLCYQLVQHGTRVNTAFTSLCLMSRQGWSEMGGWDHSRRSRYSDDIQSRWYFPPKSIAQCFQGLFVHHKHVGLFGLLKHRFNLGFHFRSSISKNTLVNSTVTLHWRYPVNVICALLCPLIVVVPIVYPYLWSIHLLWSIPIVIVNLPLVRFIQTSNDHRFNTPFHLLSVFGLSYCEGFAMGLGLLYSLCKRPFDGRFHDN